jgi:hypothetical protein
MQIKSFLIGTGLLACHACTQAQNNLSERRTRPVPVPVDSVCAPTFLNKLAFELEKREFHSFPADYADCFADF